MSKETTADANRRTSISRKAAYSKAAQKRLHDARVKLGGVKARIRSATIAGQIVVNRQLQDAERAVDANLVAAESSLARLRKSGDEVWEDLTPDVDTAWEDLSQSLKKLVAGYSEGKRQSGA
ncbi:MAG: hypothetical protein KJO01_07600 [Gammaproteobacteria bacterium]|nr:hypothetical protein [Gammaproteobacteria bacterium]MBT8111978.1 hypothetical protein [Gammaproteobacteria bacterium]NND48320.1 hypothetical protein [Woeseiaceae bacterium]NNL46678.1 hypothetical protein [Woeseiaceae bacterium]